MFLDQIALKSCWFLVLLVTVLAAPPKEDDTSKSAWSQQAPQTGSLRGSSWEDRDRPVKGRQEKNNGSQDIEDQDEEEHEHNVPWPVPNQENSTLELLRMFRPCVRCTSYERFGSVQDGGYVMCSDPELLDGVRAAFSFGIQGRDDWGLDVSRRLGNIRVFEFDCTDHRRPECDERFNGECPLRFYEECLGMPWYGRKKGYLYRTLEQHLARNPIPRHRNDTHKKQVGGDLLMKADLEGQEWATFARSRSKDLQRFRQIVVEFHALHKVHHHEFTAIAMRRILDAGFVVAHIHGNNNGPMDVFAGGRFRIPDCIEVTFVNKRALTDRQHQQCATKQEFLPQDAPNHGFFELPPAQLPGDHDMLHGYTSVNVSLLSMKARRGRHQIVARQCRWFCHMENAGPAAWPLATVSGISGLMVVGLLRTATSIQKAAGIKTN